jgi:hypothetical protein
VTEVRGSVAVGRYVVTLGSPHGSVLALAEDSESSSSTALAAALREPVPTPVERLEELVEDSATVTGRTERALELFTAVATGRIPDRAVILREVDSLLDLLRRLDRAGRHEDALRLARSLSGLLALLLRWVALVESLRIALRAARALGASLDEAWALHELGTLAAGAGETAAATAQLEDALRLRERNGDQAGAETTAVNLDVIRAALVSGGGGGGGGLPRWLLVAAGAVVLALLAAGGLALALRDGDDDGPVTTASGTTTQATTTQPTTTEETTTQETTTQGTTTTETIPLPGPASLTEQPENPTNSPEATFAFTAGGATGFECSRDGAAFSECSSPTTYDDVDAGDHSFEVHGVNETGAGEPARAVWTVDTTPPTVTIEDISAVTTWMFTFSADEPATFECRVDDEAFVECESPWEWAEPVEDEYVFEVRATDDAGNVGEASQDFGSSVG